MACDVLGMDVEAFRLAFKDSAMTRAKIGALKRNACVVLGNLGNEQDVPVLRAALADPEPLARGHAAWALGRIGSDYAVARLRTRLGAEAHTWVREEIQSALDELGG